MVGGSGLNRKCFFTAGPAQPKRKETQRQKRKLSPEGKSGSLAKGEAEKAPQSFYWPKRRWTMDTKSAYSTQIRRMWDLREHLEFDRYPVSLIHYFGGTIFSGGLVTCSVDDSTPLPGADTLLDEFPSKYDVQDQAAIVLPTAGKIWDQGPGAGCDRPICRIARDLQCTGAEHFVTLVDFKAGFEDLARGVITGLDRAVVTVDPTSASIQLAANMKDKVAQMKAGRLPATAHLENPELIEMANRIFREAMISGPWCSPVRFGIRPSPRRCDAGC